MKKSALGAAIVLGVACSSTAHATVYDLGVYDSAAGFTGTLGTVSVTGQGTATLLFDVSLNSNVFFQMQGSGAAHDVFWFDLTPFVGAVTTNIYTPGSGSYPTDGQFSIVRNVNNLGQGWSVGYDYGALNSDSSAGGNLNYYTGHLIFDLTANDGSLLNLAGSVHNGTTVYGGADLRQCPGTDPKSGSCKTGPVGFSISDRNPDPFGAVPEPSTWAMMLLGFGFVGGIMRRRNKNQTVRLTYA